MSILVRSLLAGGLLLLLAPGAHAQSVTVDEGAFQLAIDGRPAGMETFAIRRLGTGPDAQVYATAEIELTLPEGRLDLRPMLETSGSSATVTGYQMKISGQQQQEIVVRPGDRRYLIEVHSERGEQQREVRAAPGTLLLDTQVAHQYHFVSERLPTGSGTIPVIVPREGRQYDLRVTEVGTETLTIGDRSLPARHLRLEGNEELRELWVDAEGRVLRVDHPASGYRALRIAVP